MSFLSFETYLALVSYVFLRLFTLGLYVSEHRQLRFLKKLVKPGDTCIDIGANLGYFSVPLSRLIGEAGQLYAVEPVPLFRDILAKNLARFALDNVDILPYALGAKHQTTVSLGTPRVGGVVRHGQTEILEAGETKETVFMEHEAIMANPQQLFSHLARLDFIKCDVEGYELEIIPHFLDLIEAHRPLLEIETGPDAHKRQLIDWLTPLGYTAFFLGEGGLMPFDLHEHGHQIELYFLPTEKLAAFSSALC